MLRFMGPQFLVLTMPIQSWLNSQMSESVFVSEFLLQYSEELFARRPFLNPGTLSRRANFNSNLAAFRMQWANSIGSLYSSGDS